MANFIRINVHQDNQYPASAPGRVPGAKSVNLRVLYRTPVLKLMNILVFVDSFLLILVGVGFKGNQGIAFGAIYGLIGGVTAMLMFNIAVVALIVMSVRNKPGGSWGGAEAKAKAKV